MQGGWREVAHHGAVQVERREAAHHGAVQGGQGDARQLTMGQCWEDGARRQPACMWHNINQVYYFLRAARGSSPWGSAGTAGQGRSPVAHHGAVQVGRSEATHHEAVQGGRREAAHHGHDARQLTMQLRRKGGAK